MKTSLPEPSIDQELVINRFFKRGVSMQKRRNKDLHLANYDSQNYFNNYSTQF